MPSATPLVKRFWSKVNKTEACWLWTAAKSTRGYGSIGTGDRRTALAHRVAYELLVGPIPEGLTLDHLCRNHGCVNPAHLEPVTQRENVLRGVSPSARCAAVTHCPQGHPYDEANTYRPPEGGRDCRACVREAGRRWRERCRQHSEVPA